MDMFNLPLGQANEVIVVIAALLFALAVILGPLLIIGTVLIFALRNSAKKREEMMKYAISSNQPEIARTLAEKRSPWLLWIIIGIVAIVLLAKLPWFVTVALIVIAAVTYKDWGRRVFPDRVSTHAGMADDAAAADAAAVKPAVPAAGREPGAARGCELARGAAVN